MRTTWRVTKITETEGERIAELRQVSWFVKNPAWETTDDDFEGDWPEEFMDAEPGAPGAEFIDAFGKLTLDITDGLDLHAGDNIAVTLDALERIPA